MSPKLYPVIALFFAIVGTTSECFSLNNHLLFSVTSKNIARIGVINNGKGNITLNISDKAGVSVYSENIKGGQSFFKLFDLSKLPDGNYKIKASGNGEEFEKAFKITEGKVEILKQLKEVPPKFYKVDEETLIVFYQNTQNYNVKVSFEKNKDIVFEDEISGSPVKRTYSLKDLPKGVYLIFLHADKEVYSYSLTLP